MTVVPLNNLSICAAAALIISCLSIDASSSWYVAYLILAMCLCAINRLFLNAEKFIVGRDWVMVIGGDKELSKLNATLLTLDQFTNVIGPLVTGALVTWVGLRETVGIFGAASLISMLFKSVFLRLLYTSNRELHVKEDTTTSNELTNSLLKESVIYTYWRQESFSAAFGMSLLFMTVMGFGGLAVGYGSSAGLPEFIIGAFRSYGSITAILGAFSYAFFEKRYGVFTSGILGLIVQQIFAVLAVSSVFLPGSPMNIGGYFGNFTTGNWVHSMIHSFDAQNATGFDPHVDWSNFSSNGVSLASIVVFLIAIASARYGLWCLDLATTHIMQVTIPETERNTVFGVHNALCQTFSVLKDILVIILPLPATFAICIFISYGFVSAGHLFFVYYVVKTKHSPHAKRKITVVVCPGKDDDSVML
uniref:Solute carrier family 40 member n=1 Tax=Caenorhabditis tropicalis TaxID=1561998 RepID=A0A1I7TSU3_9PELO